MDERNDPLDPQQHERLCAWLFDELDSAARAAFEAELQRDPALQEERARLERTVGLVRTLGDGVPTLSQERLAQLSEAVPARRGHAMRWVAAAAACVLALGGGVLMSGAFSGLGAEKDVPERVGVAPRTPGDAVRAEPVVRDVVANAASEIVPAADASGTDAPGTGDSGPSLELSAAEPVPQTTAYDNLMATGPSSDPAGVGPGAAGVALDPVVTESTVPESVETWEWDSSVWNASLGLAPVRTVLPPGFDVFSVGGSQGAIALPRVPVVDPGQLQTGTALGDRPSVGMLWRDQVGQVLLFGGGAVDAGDGKRQPGSMRYSRAQDDLDNETFFVPFDPDALFRACRPQPGERPRDMYFRFWGDNAFVLTRNDALATFAADVDTASFVLARRYLRDGVLPERAQIRTEEFVNFFDPDLAPPAEGDFAIHTELAPSPFGGSQARYLLRVGLRAREIPVERREALALTFVVDTSGSMREDQRLELVKHALLTLVSKLDGRDRIGIVAFANDARLVLPMTAADARAEIAAVVQGLSPSGSTNAEAGLKLGYELAATALDPERHSRVVFLSDGVANVGQTDQDRINADVRARREAGILLNTIGVGMDNHNDVFLEQLADQGDGVCDYVDDARAVQRAIVERFTGAFQPVAADVKIQVEFADGRVLRWRQLGYENRAVADQDFRNDAVDAGEVGSGHQVTALFELESAAGAAADDGRWATVRVRWLPPRRAGDAAGAREAQELECVVDASAFVDTFETASPGFRRAAVVAQLAEVLRRSTHAAGDSYARLTAAIQDVVRLPAFAADEDTAELVTLVQRAEELGIARELERSDLAQAVDEYKRHHYLRHQLASLESGLQAEELDELRRQNDRLEERIRALVQRR